MAVAIDGNTITFARTDNGETLSVVNRPVWDDKKFPMTRVRQGATAKPDFDVTNLGLLFPQNDTAEIGYIITQLPHAMYPGSPLNFHIHYVADEAEIPVWKLAYRIVENGGDPTVSFTTLTSTAPVYTYSSGSILQIAPFPSIATSATLAKSAVLDIKLWRDDNLVTGDVLAKELDFHFQRNTLGSLTEWV